MAAMAQQGTLSVVSVEPLAYTPDEFATAVRHEVEVRDAKIVMIDSISGYRLSLQGDALRHRVHALCEYLRNMGVTAIVVHETPATLGQLPVTEEGLSALADNIVFLRYVEYDAELHRLIGVLKKRMSGFEHTLREVTINRNGMMVGPPLKGLYGILAGMPEPINTATPRPAPFSG
jgi:circadian clock protein KaiC